MGFLSRLFKRKKAEGTDSVPEQKMNEPEILFQVQAKPSVLLDGDNVIRGIKENLKLNDKVAKLSEDYIQINRVYKSGEKYLYKFTISPIENGTEETGLYSVTITKPGKEETVICNDPFSPFGFAPIKVYEKIKENADGNNS